MVAVVERAFVRESVQAMELRPHFMVSSLARSAVGRLRDAFHGLVLERIKAK